MKDNGRSRNEIFERLLIEIGFKDEIDANNLFTASSLTYFFIVLFACLTQKVETKFGIILILTAVMIVWNFIDKRKDIRIKYEKQIDEAISGNHKS